MMMREPGGRSNYLILVSKARLYVPRLDDYVGRLKIVALKGITEIIKTDD
jgi:hypothetical protein